MDRTLVLAKRDEEYIDEVLESIRDSGKRVCYVTFNKTPEFILGLAKKKKISEERFYFVDCITFRIRKSSGVKNSVQITDFSDLEKINKNIKSVVEKGYSLVVFDSLSNVLIYPSMNDRNISKSFNALFEYLKKIGSDVMVICYEKDMGDYSMDKTLALFNSFIKPFELFGS